MTTWMRTLHSLQPKLSFMKATTTSTRSSGTSAATAKVTGSNQEVTRRPSPHPASVFLNEFLELGGACRLATTTAWPDETRNRVPVSVLISIEKSTSTSSSPSSSSAPTIAAKCQNSYDPRLRGLIATKPRALSADDIILDKCDNEDNSDYPDRLSLPDSNSWQRQSLSLLPYEASIILSFSSKAKGAAEKADPTGKPTEEQLQKVLLKLSEDLPKFFKGPQDYSIYHEKLVFQNNIRGVTIYGLYNYARLLSILRIIGHLKFTYVDLEVLKMTTHSEDGTVRVRWRIQGIPGYKALFQIWKFPVWKLKSMMAVKADWYDAFSIFYVGGDGLIHSHVCDKMMPDEQKDKKMSRKSNLAVKLALLLGAIPRPSADDLGAVFASLSMLEQLLNRPLRSTTTAATTANVTSTGSD